MVWLIIKEIYDECQESSGYDIKHIYKHESNAVQKLKEYDEHDQMINDWNNHVRKVKLYNDRKTVIKPIPMNKPENLTRYDYKLLELFPED